MNSITVRNPHSATISTTDEHRSACTAVELYRPPVIGWNVNPSTVAAAIANGYIVLDPKEAWTRILQDHGWVLPRQPWSRLSRAGEIASEPAPIVQSPRDLIGSGIDPHDMAKVRIDLSAGDQFRSDLTGPRRSITLALSSDEQGAADGQL